MPYLVTEKGIQAVADHSADGYTTISISLARARFDRLRGFSPPKPHYKYDAAAFATYRAEIASISAARSAFYRGLYTTTARQQRQS